MSSCRSMWNLFHAAAMRLSSSVLLWLCSVSLRPRYFVVSCCVSMSMLDPLIVVLVCVRRCLVAFVKIFVFVWVEL